MVAAALAVLAFTRFDSGPPPEPGSPDFGNYEEAQIADARLSVLLGLGASFALLGAFACHSVAGRAPVERE